MKTRLILLALLPGLLHSADPFADPFASPKKRVLEESSPMIEVTAEWLQVSEADATALLHDDKPPANSLEWRQKLNSLLKDGKARVAASASVVAQGQAATSTSERESHYITGQTEFERTEQGEGNEMGYEHPVTRIKTESDYRLTTHGIRLEADASLNAPDLIHVNLLIEWSNLVREGSDRRSPEAFRNQNRGAFLIRAGGSLMIGVSTPCDDDGKLDTTQRLLCFVSARLLKP